MNKEYNSFALQMDYIPSEEFYEVYNKYAKYLPEKVDYRDYDPDYSTLDEYLLTVSLNNQLHTTSISAYFNGDNSYDIEGCYTLEDVNKVQEILDSLELKWDRHQKELEIEWVKDMEDIKS